MKSKFNSNFSSSISFVTRGRTYQEIRLICSIPQDVPFRNGCHRGEIICELLCKKLLQILITRARCRSAVNHPLKELCGVGLLTEAVWHNMQIVLTSGFVLDEVFSPFSTKIFRQEAVNSPRRTIFAQSENWMDKSKWNCPNLQHHHNRYYQCYH